MDRCSCHCGNTCPIGRGGSELRCTVDELKSKLFDIDSNITNTGKTADEVRDKLIDIRNNKILPTPLKLSDHIVNLVHLMRQFGDIDVYGCRDGQFVDLHTGLYHVGDKMAIGMESLKLATVFVNPEPVKPEIVFVGEPS